MDIVDIAQNSQQRLQDAALMNHKQAVAKPTPPMKMSDSGRALCIDCDDDITERRKIIHNAQRCTRCQQDVTNLKHRGR